MQFSLLTRPTQGCSIPLDSQPAEDRVFHQMLHAHVCITEMTGIKLWPSSVS